MGKHQAERAGRLNRTGISDSIEQPLSMLLDQSRYKTYLSIRDKFVEVGGKVELVYPRGTSSWAYDGSGKLTRNNANYTLATFQNSKQFNADLNGSYNIAARYWAYKLKLAYRNGRQFSSSKSPGEKSRMPITLSALWMLAGKDREAAYVREAP